MFSLRRVAIVGAIALIWGTCAAHAQPILADDFAANDFSPAGRLFYKKNAEQEAGAFRFLPGAGPEGAGALELSVREACPKQDPLCSERAEVWEKPSAHVPYLEGAWYAFAVKFAEPIPQDDHRYVIAQWKREIVPGADGDFSPLLALRLNHGKLYATVETGLVATSSARRDNQADCPVGETPVFVDQKTRQTRALVAAQPGWTLQDGRLFRDCTAAIRVTPHEATLPAPEGGWIDFVIYSRPDPKGDGRIEIIANGKPVVSVNGPIGHDGAGLGLNQYFKFGPYRAGGAGVWTLQYAHFRRGPRCMDVTAAENCPTGE